jgi:hypothetical protein
MQLKINWERKSAGSAVSRGMMAIILAVMLIASFMPARAYAESPTITVSSADDVKPGHEFSIEVSISANTGIAAAVLEFVYDHEVMQLLSLGSEGLLAEVIVPNINDSTIVVFSSYDITEDGLLFSANFLLKDDIPEGSYEISLRQKHDLPANLVNTRAEPVAASFINGEISYGSASSTTTLPGGFTLGKALTLPIVTAITAVIAGIVVFTVIIRRRSAAKRFDTSQRRKPAGKHAA